MESRFTYPRVEILNYQGKSAHCRLKRGLEIYEGYLPKKDLKKLGLVEGAIFHLKIDTGDNGAGLEHLISNIDAITITTVGLIPELNEAT